MIRPIDPRSESELDWVATRMRQTLAEVLGAEQGSSMYTMEWLRERVRFHLDPARCTGAVLIAEATPASDRAGTAIAGHTIVRLDRYGEDENGEPIGLFSTTFVDPEHRGRGIASALLSSGEQWLLSRGMTRLCTYTSDTNVKLIRLYEKHGYGISARLPDKRMVILSKSCPILGA